MNCFNNLTNAIEPIKTSILCCLLVMNIRYVSPPSINKSDNLILTFVKAINPIKITIVHNIGVLFVRVKGKCSLIFFIVLPFIVW